LKWRWAGENEKEISVEGGNWGGEIGAI